MNSMFSSCIIFWLFCMNYVSSTNSSISDSFSILRNSYTDVLLGETEECLGKPDHFKVADFDWKSVSTPFIIVLWIMLACVAKIGFHLSEKITSIFPDSSLLIFLGLLVGLIMKWGPSSSSIPSLEHDTFFLFLLPPIVFDAGYFMPNREFFGNLGTILTFALIGTVWNAAAIGVSLWYVGLTGVFGSTIPFFHAMVYSSLISATDPVAVLAVFEEIHVNEILYIVVFGEALLNDAVGVVLYEMFGTYAKIFNCGSVQTTDYINGILAFFVVACGGVAVGLIWSIIISFTTRWTQHVRVLEPLFVLVMAYCSYLTGQMFTLSAILAIVFCGLTMKQYVEGNISHKSQATIKYVVKMLSLCSETIIFMFLGLSTVSAQAEWNTPFVCLTILFCLVYRSTGVVFLTFILNKLRLSKLELVEQFVLSYGGLRGAMVYGLVSSLDATVIPEKQMYVTTTIVFIYFSVFLQGMTIKPLVNFLKVKRADIRDKSMQEEILDHVVDHSTAGIEAILGIHGHNWLREKWEYLNMTYVKRLLMKDPPKTFDLGIIANFTKITIREAMDHLARYGSFQSTSAVRSFTTLMGQHNWMTNVPTGDNDKRSSLLVGKPLLDMKVFDIRPGRKQKSAVARHHSAIEQTYRAKPKRGKVAPKEDEIIILNHHYTQPYKMHDFLDKTSHAKAPTIELTISPPKKGVRFDSNEDLEENKMQLIGDALYDNVKDYKPYNLIEDEDMLTIAEKTLPWQHECTPLSPSSKYSFASKFDFEPEDQDNEPPLTAAERELPWKVESGSSCRKISGLSAVVDIENNEEFSDKIVYIVPDSTAIVIESLNFVEKF